MNAIQETTIPEEREGIFMQISTVANAHMEFVHSLEDYILNALVTSTDIDQLILAFGALASNAQTDVQHEISSFLLGLHQQVSSLNSNDTSTLSVVILAMGNTGSENVVSIIVSYVDSSIADYQRAAIRALLKFTHLVQATSKLAETLKSGISEDTLVLVVNTIIKGHTYSDDLDIELGIEAVYPLLQSLVSAVAQTNNTELTSIVAAYIREVLGDQSPELLA